MQTSTNENLLLDFVNVDQTLSLTYLKIDTNVLLMRLNCFFPKPWFHFSLERAKMPHFLFRAPFTHRFDMYQLGNPVTFPIFLTDVPITFWSDSAARSVDLEDVGDIFKRTICG